MLDKKEELFLQELTDAKGVPGNEDQVRAIFKNTQNLMQIKFFMMV